MRILREYLGNKKEIFKEKIGNLQQVCLWNLLEMNEPKNQFPHHIGETSPGQLAHTVERWMHRRGFKRLTVRNLNS
jgi:hypothetical protein